MMNQSHGCEWYLTNDVMIEILCCLPLKSLARFKAVSKTWYENISSRDFAGRYRKGERPWGLLIQQKNIPSSFLQWDKSCLSISSSKYRNGILFPVEGGFGELIRRYFGHAPPRIVGPLDGLICIYEDVPRWNNTPWGKTIALCNPYLGGKVEIIPPPPLSSSDPLLSRRACCNLGFGYDCVTRDYKIVMVFSYINNDNNNSLHVIEVYSRATNSWKELDCNVLSGDISIIRPITPYQDGSFAHWHAWKRQSTTGLYDWVVLSFDVRNEVFMVTPLPPCFPGVQGVKAITNLEAKMYSRGIGIHSKEDSLALDYFPSNGPEWFIDRWQLKRLGGGWDPLTPRVQIDLSPGVSLMENNHGLLSRFDRRSHDVILDYLPPQGTLVTLTIPKCYYDGEIEHVYLYEPSLIELKDDPINHPVRSLSGYVCKVGLAIAAVGVVVYMFGVAVANAREEEEEDRNRCRDP